MRAQEFIVESVHAYHGTFQPTLTKFNALSHFGTKQAAEDRLKEKARREKIKTPGRVYEVVLDIKNPFIAKDFAGVHSPTHFVFDLKSAKLISQEELSAINQHMGTPKQAQLLIKKLRELGFDSIAYKNKYEDKGSTSYVILDPTQVVSVRPLKQKEAVTEASIPDEIEDFLYDLQPDDVGVEEFGPYRVHYEGFTDDCQSSSDYCADPEAVYQQVFADHIAREGGRRPIEQNFTGDEDYPILYSIFKIPRQVKERAERARDAIENIVTMGNIDDYFVRSTDIDKIGYSAHQDFGRTPDIGDPDYDPNALPKKKGRPALWFYPARYYLQHKDLFAGGRPYIWLVKRRPNAYLQPTKGATQPETPKGMVRAGLMHNESGVPVAVFFRPEFDVVDKWYEPKRIKENFADKKVKGKSRPGRVKRAGASCKGSVSSLRAKARKYGGEKGKMYHWCANMKGGRKNESAVEEGWKQNVAAGILGAGMALGSGAAQADSDVFNKKFSPAEIQQLQTKADLTQRYYNELVRRAKEDGRIMDRTTLNMLKAQAEDAAARSVQQRPQAPQAKSALPGTQPSEIRRSKNYDNFEEGWKSAIGGAALAGAMALGGAGAAQAQSKGPAVSPATVIQQIQSGKIQNQKDLESALSKSSAETQLFTYKVLQKTAGQIVPELKFSDNTNDMIKVIKNQGSAPQAKNSASTPQYQPQSYEHKPISNFESVSRKRK